MKGVKFKQMYIFYWNVQIIRNVQVLRNVKCSGDVKCTGMRNRQNNMWNAQITWNIKTWEMYMVIC